MPFGTPPAPMGIAGYCEFKLPSGASGLRSYPVRATSCDIGLYQEIDAPDVLDALYDRNVFVVKPEEIEGQVDFTPTSCNRDPTDELYNLAVVKNYYGRLNSFHAEIYNARWDASFRYTNCFVSEFSYKVVQQQNVSVSVNLWAMDREVINWTPSLNSGMARTVGWQDALVRIRTSGFDVGGEYIRSFDFSVDNNLKRYFTGGGSRLLKVQDISAGQRDIEGSITLMGRHPQLSKYAINNPIRCQETATLEFGHIGGDVLSPLSRFNTVLPNVIYSIEELNLSQDIFETIVNWTCVPANNLLQSRSRTA